MSWSEEERREYNLMKKKAAKGRIKTMEADSQHLDPFTKYGFIAPKPHPPQLVLAKYRANARLSWFSKPPICKDGQEGAEADVQYFETCQAGFAAYPDVAVDLDEGSYDVLLTGGGQPAGLDSLPVRKDADTNK